MGSMGSGDFCHNRILGGEGEEYSEGFGEVRGFGESIVRSGRPLSQIYAEDYRAFFGRGDGDAAWVLSEEDLSGSTGRGDLVPRGIYNLAARDGVQVLRYLFCAGLRLFRGFRWT